MDKKKISRILKKTSAISLALTMIFMFIPVMGQAAYADAPSTDKWFEKSALGPGTTYGLTGDKTSPVFGFADKKWYCAGYDTTAGGPVFVGYPSNQFYSKFNEGVFCDNQYNGSYLQLYLRNTINEANGYPPVLSKAAFALIKETRISTRSLGEAYDVTTEKLYAMNGTSGSYVIYAGTNDCVEISLDHPWIANSPWIEDNPSFWLRAPSGGSDEDQFALHVYCKPQGYGGHKCWVDLDYVETEAPVLPAFCLNLESFLFASPIDDLSPEK